MDQKLIQQQYKALNSVYNPERQLVQQQLSALPGQATAQKTALEQAKINAFRDISSNAQGRGVYFSGFRPSEEARYTGETFLPALANLEATQSQNRTALQQALIEINQRQQQQATGYAQDILTRRQQQQQFERELAAQRERDAANRSASSATSIPSTSQFLVQAFSGYQPGVDRFYTEQEVIPALMANYNLSRAAAAKLAYKYRDEVYKE